MSGLGWSEALGRDEVRSYALDRFRDSGFDAETFRHKAGGRAAMVEALVATEDWLEMVHPRWPERASIRAVRSPLERRVWP